MSETETFIDKMKRRKALTTAAADDFLLEPAGDIVKPDDPHYDDRARLYCARALQGICEQIAHTPEGNRNQTLNDGALRALRWVLGGNLNQERAVHQLREAGQVCGLPGDEIARTLNSAWIGARRLGAAYPTLRDRPAVEPFPLAPEGVDPTTGEITPPLTDDERSAKVRELFPTLDWHALWADETEEEWIVEPLLPARRLVALYSAPKLGKSLLLLEIACAVASGRPVLGVEVERARAVLYVDFENDPKSDIRQRLQDMGYGPGDLDQLHYLSFPTMAGLDSERGGVELMAAVHEYGCEVVVVDTVSRAIAGEENENDTWLNFYRHTGLKLKQAGVSLVRLDHSGKDETKGQRGGSAKSGDVDAVWRLSRVKDDTYRLDCEAARMPVREKVLVIHREEFPLRHRVDAQGDRAAFFLLVDAAEADLIAAGVPVDYGRDLAGKALRAAGYTVKNGPLSAAIKRRKEAAERAENLSPE